MKNITDETIRLQPAIMEEIAKVAAKEGTTVEQFVSVTLREKLKALQSLDLLQKRAAGGSRATFRELLENSKGNEPPREGDELPESLRSEHSPS